MIRSPSHPLVRQIIGLLLLILVLLPLLWSLYSDITKTTTSTVLPVKSVALAREGPAFAMAITIDHVGNVWAGSEDEGVWERLASNGRWRSFTVKDGIGDNNGYAIAEDQLGRIWVGHLNHGVSVYNGKRWQIYETAAGLSRPGTLAGPIGQRVFAIRVCPTDGDVWIATNEGLTRYSEKNDSWNYYTRAQGLSTNSIQAIAFDQHGNIYCATPFDGLILSNAAGNYAQWRQIRGPDQPPCNPAGRGLPSNLCNDVIVSREGWVFVATDDGLAWSCDHGKTWRYTRGRDYAAKVRARYGGPPKGWHKQPGALLNSDYITCLAQDGEGRLQIAHRDTAVEALDLQPDGDLVPAADPLSFAPKANIKSCVAVPNSSSVAFGCYFSGVLAPGHISFSTRNIKIPPLPRGAAPPTLAILNSILGRLAMVPPATRNQNGEVPIVAKMSDDWTTRGNWIGRYGRYWACLCAMEGHNYLWGAGPDPVYYRGRIGPHHMPGDSIRYWVQWLYTDELRVLEIPPVYLDSRIAMGLTTARRSRREAENDDHGEAYLISDYDGPHLYYDFSIPAGLFVLSLYDVNKDGHNLKCPYRDYSISIYSKSDIGTDGREILNGQALARGRIDNFWEGYYTRFLVQGPAKFTVKIGRNFSFDTIIAGLFLDTVSEEPAPYFETAQQWKTETNRQNEALEKRILQYRQDSANYLSHFAPADTEFGAATRLLSELEKLRLFNPQKWAEKSDEDYPLLLRWFLQHINSIHGSTEAKGAVEAYVGTCYYWSGFYRHWEQSQITRGLVPARSIEKALRWDHVHSYSDRGYQTVKQYVAEHGHLTSGRTPISNAKVAEPGSMNSPK